jgi:hypothetical protein
MKKLTSIVHNALFWDIETSLPNRCIYAGSAITVGGETFCDYVLGDWDYKLTIFPSKVEIYRFEMVKDEKLGKHIQEVTDKTFTIPEALTVAKKKR